MLFLCTVTIVSTVFLNWRSLLHECLSYLKMAKDHFHLSLASLCQHLPLTPPSVIPIFHSPVKPSSSAPLLHSHCAWWWDQTGWSLSHINTDSACFWRQGDDWLIKMCEDALQERWPDQGEKPVALPGTLPILLKIGLISIYIDIWKG